MRERFILDRKENILFINFAGLRIGSRGQVDEMAGLVRAAYEAQGRRLYAVVDYEGTEIAPEIVDYYGERIKELQDRYALYTVRYSSSGFTRSVFRYLGAAIDLESNTFASRAEATRAIREFDRRVASGSAPVRALLDPRRGLLGKIGLVWLAGLLALLAVWLLAPALTHGQARAEVLRLAAGVAALLFAAAGLATGATLFFTVLRPLRGMEGLARHLAAGATYAPPAVNRDDEVGRLAQALNEAALHLRRDIDRLSGLYHISLMMGTGADTGKLCELLTRKIARLLGAQMCVILLYDEREQCLNAQLPAYGMQDEHLRLLRSELNQESIAAWVFQTGESYLTNDVAGDGRVSGAAADLLGARNVLALPLQAGEHTFGALEVMNKEGGFLEEDKRLVTIFAAQAAQLLANARLFEQVRESEERYRQIFESALDGLYRATPAGRLVTVNPALAAMLGYGEPPELIGRNLYDEFFTEPAVAAGLRAELAGRGQALDVECRLRRQGGEALPARLSIRVVTDRADHEPYHHGIVKDITEQQRLAEQLILSERLAVVGELVAGVAHEVRNPLFGITTTLSALARRLENREAVRPFLDVVRTEVGRLNHLMEQLLEHSRPARLDGGVADLGAVIREVLGEFSLQAGARGVAVELACPPDLPGLRFDRRKMHGVFANLLDNALQHTPPGGRVRVVVRAPAAGAARELDIQFRDTGEGIAPENLGKVFEPFFTTRATGTGLGLAIVRKTIYDHGGTIAAHSAPGQGTAFTIRLPLE